MLAYRDGDAGAFEALYRRHRTRLYRFVLRSIRSPGIAEELYQEVWMRVIEARGSYFPKARFTTWLFTIAHNRMVDHWRRCGLSLVSLDEADPPADARDPARQATPTRSRTARTSASGSPKPRTCSPSSRTR